MEGLRLEQEAPRVSHAVLFLCTALTATWAGTELLPEFAGSSLFGHAAAVVRDPALLLRGLPFSLTLLTLLGIHEWGHFHTARRLGIRATWPYFLPGPPYLSVGTFGAFIRLKSALPHRSALVRVGGGGPAAGFLACLVAMALGRGLLVLGYRCPTDLGVNVHLPMGYRLADGLLGGSWEGSRLLFENPVLAAAWIGFFVQGLNLLPCGQLDGGHVLYAFARRRHRTVSAVFGLSLFTMTPWGFHFAVWGALLLFLGYGHPPCLDEERPLGLADRALGVASAMIFVLCFHPLPFQWT